MKVAFVGKGGSGKTTISSLFCLHLQNRNLPVLAIDADINQHMQETLGLGNTPIPALGMEMKTIKDYLRGTNPKIPSASEMIKTSPPGSGSKLLNLQEINPLFENFSLQSGSLKFIATGPFGEEDLGVKCYHSKVGAVELILNHLIDKEKEYVVVDMTAGADTFASGMFTKFDMTYVVVEPTLKSFSVFEQYKHYAEGYGIKIAAVGNKISDNADLEFLQSKLGSDSAATFGSSAFVKDLEKGKTHPITELEPENLQTLETLQKLVDSTQKDWKKFYNQMIEFHIKNSESWANVSIGKDLRNQVDPNFSLK